MIMSLKKLLLSNSESSSSFEPDRSFKKTRFNSIIIHNPKANKKSEFHVVKVAKENAVSYEEFLDILQKPNVFIIKWSSNTECCNRRQEFSNFEISNITGTFLLKGKYFDDSVRVFDNRNRLFMMLEYKSKMDREAVLSVPNSNIPLARMKKLPSYMPYNKRFQMTSEHFPELNFNVEHQTLSGSLYKYTITSGKKLVSKVLQPSTGGHVYVMVDENVSVFQKSGIVAAAIYISQRPMKNVGKLICISIIFFLVFIFGFVVVASTVFDLRSKENEGPKFPNKLKSGEDAV